MESNSCVSIGSVESREKQVTLLSETENAIFESGHSVEGIAFIGSEDGHYCSWDEFKEMANVDYDGGYGAAEVATDLVILFSDGIYMKRGEYDGSEWWEFNPPMEKPEKTHKIKRLVGAYWPTLEDLQNTADTHHNPSLS